MAIVRVTPAAQQQFMRLSLVVQARIEQVYRRLERWPEVSGAKSLSGRLAGRYRIRTGDYRVQFFITGDVVTIEKVGHRDRFYEE